MILMNIAGRFYLQDNQVYKFSSTRIADKGSGKKSKHFNKSMNSHFFPLNKDEILFMIPCRNDDRQNVKDIVIKNNFLQHHTFSQIRIISEVKN